MSQENVEIVRRALEVFNSTAFDRGEEPDLRFYAPDVELDRSDAALDAAVYHGHDGLREWVSLLREMWEGQRLEPLEFISIGEDRVVVPVRIVSVGRGEIETVAHAAGVWTIREGLVTRMVTFQSKADALGAVGLGANDGR